MWCLLNFGSSIVVVVFCIYLPTEDVASENVNVRFCLEVTDGGSRMCQIQDMFLFVSNINHPFLAKPWRMKMLVSDCLPQLRLTTFQSWQKCSQLLLHMHTMGSSIGDEIQLEPFPKFCQIIGKKLNDSEVVRHLGVSMYMKPGIDRLGNRGQSNCFFCVVFFVNSNTASRMI